MENKYRKHGVILLGDGLLCIVIFFIFVCLYENRYQIETYVQTKLDQKVESLINQIIDGEDIMK